jgi:hypothetical protein
MCGSHRSCLGLWIASTFVGLAIMPASSRADDNGFFSRLFRLGGNQPATAPAHGSSGSEPGRGVPNTQPGTYESAFGDIGSGRSSASPSNGSSRPPGPTVPAGPISTEGPSTPDFGRGDSGPRVTPRPRVAPAVTSADPLLTRLALGKSNDGSQFGMFLQVFADGTVIDSEGVHHLSPSDIRPIAEAIQSGEVARLRGHCGTPSNDFIDYVQVVVFERRMGRLQAHSFSYGGNPQGCDSGIRHIHAILEALQAKLSGPPASASGSSVEASGRPATIRSTDARVSSAPPSSGTVIPLTPLSPR